jgi:ABC-type amino acid transport system permease subunit
MANEKADIQDRFAGHAAGGPIDPSATGRRFQFPFEGVAHLSGAVVLPVLFDLQSRRRRYGARIRILDLAPVDAAVAPRVRVQPADFGNGNGNRNSCRRRPRAWPDIAELVARQILMVGDPVFPKLSVVLFFAMFLLPFEFDVAGLTIPLPDWVKATIGLSLPVMANVSEIVRGAVKSLPSGQWEAAESLAYTRRQTLWLIILPQCVKRMLPPWMNLYSILTMATVLASIVGVSEVMTLTGQVLSSEGGRPELLAPFYSFILLLFFIYCYPIACWTVRLEKKFAVVN